MEHEQHPTGPTFDTLKAAEALQKAGFTGVQAKAVTRTIVEVQDSLATKADLRELRAESKADLRELRTEMKAEFKALRAEMASQQADTKAEFKTLRAEMAELRAEIAGLRAEVEALNKIVSTLAKLVLGVTVPLAGIGLLAMVGFMVDYFFLSR